MTRDDRIATTANGRSTLRVTGVMKNAGCVTGAILQCCEQQPRRCISSAHTGALVQQITNANPTIDAANPPLMILRCTFLS